MSGDLIKHYRGDLYPVPVEGREHGGLWRGTGPREPGLSGRGQPGFERAETAGLTYVLHFLCTQDPTTQLVDLGIL